MPTLDTRQGLLRAIAFAPDEDTPRLMYADYLDETATCEADRARAELIRVQVLMVRDPAAVAFNTFCRADELIRTHETTWRRPVCPKCEGRKGWEVGEFFHNVWENCPTCHGTGSTGPLSERDNVWHDPGDERLEWKYPVTWVRGFPRVKCRLDEIGRDEWVPCDQCNGTGAVKWHHGSKDCPKCSDRSCKGKMREWTPTTWAIACVREGASFEVTDKRRFHETYPLNHGEGEEDKWAWYLDNGNHFESQLPLAILKELTGYSEYDNAVRFDTEAEAIAARDGAVLKIVARAAYPEESP